jgi:hypothetical protein
MMSKWKGVILAALLALPAAALAQPAAHDWDIQLGGQGSATSDFRAKGGRAGGNFGAGLSLEYFVNDNVEVGVRQSLGYASNGLWNGSTRVAADYNIILDKFVPFIGVNGGYAYGNRHQTDSWILSPEAGIKYYLQSKAFIYGMAEYQVPTRGRDSLGNGNWVFSLGIGMNL